MRRALSILFWLYFSVSLIVFFFVALIIFVTTAPFDRLRRANHLFSCAWGWSYIMAFPGLRLKVTGRRRIEHGKATIIAVNHTSMADIPLCFTLFRQFKWVSKREVFNTPGLGWNMWLCGYIPLVRGEAGSIDKMMARCRDYLDAGMSILLFPEGTRSRDGELQPFKHGGFTLALDTGVPVVPVAIHGGHDFLGKGRIDFGRTSNLHVEVLDPVPSDSYDEPAALAEVVHDRIRVALGQQAR